MNNVTADRFLASNRATVVTIYLQEKDIIDPARLVSVGYGEWRPVSSNDTSAGRAENRRVELIVTRPEITLHNIIPCGKVPVLLPILECAGRRGEGPNSAEEG